MILKQIQPLSPQERAEKLGLNVADFFYSKMSDSAADETNFIKKKDRSNWKVNNWRCS
jgi:hypothetical protein